MAHIAACLAESDGETSSLRSFKANTFSPEASTDSLVSLVSVDDKKPFAWRMHNTEGRKYQLFPKDKQLPPVGAGKQVDLDQASAMSPEKAEKTEKSGLANGLRMRIKEHNLTRRRKVSVPELGPMTTVQEAAMDSPTIPGRPALHERSISSPANPMRHNQLAELDLDAILEAASSGRPADARKPDASPQKTTLGPRNLAPLTIPNQGGLGPGPARKIFKSSTFPHEPPPRSALRVDDSPRSRAPYTPLAPHSASTWTTTPRSATTAVSATTSTTPVSAPAESRSSPTPWERLKPKTSLSTLQSSNAENANEYDLQPHSASAVSHRRNQSDSASVMERGRPRKRSDGTPIGGTHKRINSNRDVSADISAERKAFETLPQGWKPSEAVDSLQETEVAYLQNQARDQALRFEVLRKEDVESLSKELRHLDERTDYLRRTYTSLRAGRRNLHTRICQYLRSPRVAKFSYDSMLKQEEALAELDSSIDDWISKLEHAENRRTRVRQKLLEHVAAAATLGTCGAGPAGKDDVSAVSESLQHAMGVRGGARPAAASPPHDVSTPPRSPVKGSSGGGLGLSPARCASPSHTPSPSPQRVVARVPSVIPEAPVEESDAGSVIGEQPVERPGSLASHAGSTALERIESIRVYADSDVYALLADVENEFTKLNDGEGAAVPAGAGSGQKQQQQQQQQQRETSVKDGDCKVLHRKRSHDILNGTAPQQPESLKTGLSGSPKPLAQDHRKNAPSNDGDVFLTAAVFQTQPTPVGA
ncbi:hypothetical protein GGR56DRAFT_667222 [Xylariaceae sp. FL0804]|nr:hypothetical protein GGR56DRAFT_667222 [Xylariaceae sp. FL0804]